MEKLKKEKDKLRKEIAHLKSTYSSDDLTIKSEEVMSVLEITGVFQDAKNICIYYNMPNEVATIDFIKRWEKEKNFYLPVTLGDEIVFRKFNSSTTLEKSDFGVWEPVGENLTNLKLIDLVIVPGVAFDRKMNRMGYGKGYYDRFLQKVKAPSLGVCFEFQLFDSIPTGETDMKMNYLVSENDLIW